MPNYNPLPIEVAVTDFNNNGFSSAKSDGIYMGRLLMKNEIMTLIRAANPKPTKAVLKLLEQIEGVQIEIDPRYNDSVR